MLEKGDAGARYNAVAEDGIAVRDIATVIGRGLNVPVAALPPEEAAAHFGGLAAFVGLDLLASISWHRVHGPGSGSAGIRPGPD